MNRTAAELNPDDFNDLFFNKQILLELRVWHTQRLAFFEKESPNDDI